MRLDPGDPSLRSLLDAPSPATLTVYAEPGRAVTVPVWFRLDDGAFEVVIADGDPKIAYLQRDPRCVLVIFEAVRPFRGIQVRANGTLRPDHDADVRRAIASRYLGAEAGTVYAEPARRRPGVVLRLPLSAARAWDLGDRIP